MSSERVSPNEVSFSAGISACEKGDRWQVALEILSEMATSEASPNVFSYSACISACERASQWQLALVLLAQMFTAGIVPDQIILNTLLTARDKGTQWEMAFHLFWAAWRESEHCTPPHAPPQCSRAIFCRHLQHTSHRSTNAQFAGLFSPAFRIMTLSIATLCNSLTRLHSGLLVSSMHAVLGTVFGIHEHHLVPPV